MRWFSFLADNLGLISFAFAVDFLWPPNPAQTILLGIGFDLPVSKESEIIGITVLSALCIAIFLAAFFRYDAGRSGEFDKFLNKICKGICWIGSGVGLMRISRGLVYICARARDFSLAVCLTSPCVQIVVQRSTSDISTIR